MALSRQNVITSCVVGFLSWTVLSRLLPALRLLPYAFIAGVLTAVAGLLYLILFNVVVDDATDRHAPPRTSSLVFSLPTAFKAEVAQLGRRLDFQQSSTYLSLSPVTSRLNKLIESIVRDFVTSWHSKISTSNAFSNEVDNTLREAVRKLIVRVVKLDWTDIGVIRILPTVNGHLKSFTTAEHEVRGRNRDVAESEEMDVTIATKYKGGRLHPATSVVASDTTALQQHHLRRVVGRLLPELLPDNMISSNAVLVIIRELLACAVLSPVMQLLADPDTINQLIEAYGRSVLRERKSVRKLREALEEHASPKRKSSKAIQMPQLNANDNDRSFEHFIKAIRQCNSLSDATRSRSQVTSQVERHSSLNARDAAYLRRLEIGRRLLDERVAQLSSQLTSPVIGARPKLPFSTILTRATSSLRQILYDASGLPYFMEFMDRLKMMSLVQFWIVVDGFRDPLGQDSGDSEKAPLIWTQSDVQNLLQIHSTYLMKPELKASPEVRQAVTVFLNAEPHASAVQYVAAIRAIRSLQNDVFTELVTHYFEDFRKSDLYYKWVTTEDSIASAAATLSDGSGIPQSLGRSPQKSFGQTRLRRSDLRRAALSSSDLQSSAAKAERSARQRRSESRRSVDESGRRPLFGDDLGGEDDDDPLARSTQSLDSIADGAEQTVRERETVVAAVQAALEDIIDEKMSDSLVLERDADKDGDESMFGANVQRRKLRTESISQALEREKPSLDSLGLLGTTARSSVFLKGDLFGEEQKLWEDDTPGAEMNDDENDTDRIQEAAPGDLGLAELVQTLSLDISKLEAQQSVLESLTAKAELTNNNAELRILRKSKTSLDREIHRKELQRQHYIVQESDSSLYGKATISIKSIMVGKEEDGHEFALYVIEVQRQAGEKGPPVTWAIMRRYSEFYDLNKRLRERYSSVRDLEFPKKQMVFTLQKEFLRKRRAALERYLQDLLAYPAICRSIEFRAFLSQQSIRPLAATSGGGIDRQDFISRIYNSVTDGMEEFPGNVPVLDQLSLAGQNIINAASYASPVMSINHNVMQSGYVDTPEQAAEAQDEISAFERNSKSEAEGETTRFIKPICDFFLEVFHLHQGHNWLRGRALVVVLQQLLGGTVERKVRETVRSLTSEESMARYLDLLLDIMWPGGQLRTSPPLRTPTEKAASKREAGLVLAALLPDMAGGVVGRSNASKAAKRIHATLNNARLNQHLVYTLLDEIVEIAFGFRVHR